MFTNITPTQLRDTLAAVEPVKLKGLALLRRRQPPPGPRAGAGCWFPANIKPHILAAAATEIIHYMASCNRAMSNLQKLPPIPVGAPVEEWPL